MNEEFMNLEQLLKGYDLVSERGRSRVADVLHVAYGVPFWSLPSFWLEEGWYYAVCFVPPGNSSFDVLWRHRGRAVEWKSGLYEGELAIFEVSSFSLSGLKIKTDAEFLRLNINLLEIGEARLQG